MAKPPEQSAGVQHQVREPINVHGDDDMFVSQPEFEIPFPPELAQPGSQHWRFIELTLHVPWFLVSVEYVDVERPDCTVTRTLCVAWDSDLVELLSAIEPQRVKGIVYMMPGWTSPTNQWTSREICEVWRFRSACGNSIVLRDRAGKKFHCSFVPDHEQPFEKELILRIEPTELRQRHLNKPNRLLRGANTRKGSV